MDEFDRYQSFYSWRYGSDAMRQIWSERSKRRLWREIWVAVARVQAEMGLVTQEQVDDLQAHVDDIDIPRAIEIEKEIHHDLMAEVRAFAEKAPLGGGVIHMGMTSMDIVDNTDALRVQRSLDLILERFIPILERLAAQIETWADTPVMGFTHLQPAEPTTLGYRLAVYGQDLLTDWNTLKRLRASLRGKGFKGAVGTSASFLDLLGEENIVLFEERLSEILELPFYDVTNQVYPRKQDYNILSALAGVAASLHKLAFDLRILQSPPIGEMSEPFGKNQVGSSAMPFKKNPIASEKMDSIARLLAQFPRTAWDNAALSLLERTLDDSANRRTILPEAFLITDELLLTADKILSDWVIQEAGIERNFERYAPFAALEAVLMALGRAGADRQEMHERLREHAMAAWQKVSLGEPNPLAERVQSDTELQRYLSEEKLADLMRSKERVGLAPQRARRMAENIHKRITSGGDGA
jgi:adenylosuccinate lyase